MNDGEVQQMASKIGDYRREDLYGQIWSKPIRAVAREYGVSDSAIIKLQEAECAATWPGYWAMKGAGYARQMPPLPSLEEGQPEVISSRVHFTQPDGETGQEGSELVERESDPAWKVLVPDKLVKPHALVSPSQKLRSPDLMQIVR